MFEENDYLIRISEMCLLVFLALANSQLLQRILPYYRITLHEVLQFIFGFWYIMTFYQTHAFHQLD